MNNYQEVLTNILDHIYDSGLYDKIDKLKLSIVGDFKEFVDWYNMLSAPAFQKNPIDVSKIEVIEQHPKTNTFEFFTLRDIYFDAIEEDIYCLYLHTKGISQQKNPNIKDWVNYMLYYNVVKFQDCLDNLETFDTVGVNLNSNPEGLSSNPALWGYKITPTHYSGNFWWSKSSNIRTLPDPLKYASYEQYQRYRIACECWICMNPNLNPQCLFRSNTNHYMTPYPTKMYIK